MNGRRRLIGSFNHGSMANAMMQAIGAQATFPGRQVVSLSGDGGFAMMMGDFLTSESDGPSGEGGGAQQRHPRVCRAGDESDGFVDVGCELKNPNFAAMAEAIGIKGIRVEKPQDLKEALTEAFNHPGPALVDVVSERQELIMPPKTTLAQAQGFGLFLMRAVLDGRAKELIDLAKANLSR